MKNGHKKFVFDPMNGLFLPPYLIRRGNSERSSQADKYIKTFVSGKEVYGHAATLDDIKKILEPLDLKTTLVWLSKLNMSIERKGIMDGHFQEEIAHNLFRDNEPFQKVISLLRRDKAILIHSAQLECLERLAVLSCSGEVEKQEDVLKALGEAIIRFADHIETNQELTVGFRERQIDEQKRIFREFTVRNFFINSTEESTFYVPRYLTLFRDLPPSLVHHQDYIDISKALMDSMGISLEDFHACLLGLLCYWQGCGIENDKPALLRIDNLFDGTSISREAKEKFLQAIAMDLGEARKVFDKESDSQGGLYYNRLGMIRKPLVILDNAIACLSFDYFSQQIGDQLYWRCLDQLSKQNRDLGDRFTRFFGELFAKYVCDSLKRVLGDRFKEKVQYKYGGGEGEVDGIIVYPEAVVVLEMKGGRLTIKTKTTGEFSGFERDLKKILTEKKGAHQLDQATKAIRDGALNEAVGLDISKHTIFPVLVLSESFPIEPLLWNYYADFLESNGLLSGEKVRPLTIMDVEEIEILSSLADGGKSFESTLSKKTETQKDCAFPMKNFIYHNNIPLRSKASVDAFKNEISVAAKKLFGRDLDDGTNEV